MKLGIALFLGTKVYYWVTTNTPSIRIAISKWKPKRTLPLGNCVGHLFLRPFSSAGRSPRGDDATDDLRRAGGRAGILDPTIELRKPTGAAVAAATPPPEKLSVADVQRELTIADAAVAVAQAELASVECRAAAKRAANSEPELVALMIQVNWATVADILEIPLQTQSPPSQPAPPSFVATVSNPL